MPWAIGTRALDVALAAKPVPERPPHSIGNEPALDLEDDCGRGRLPDGLA